jgi:hypothetical protein
VSILHCCQALDANGRQCRRAAERSEKYHGDSEIYDYSSRRPMWVKVWFCDRHLDTRKPKA